MQNNISVREWTENYNDCQYDGKDVDTQIKAGWYDWFCRDSSLANKTEKMASMVKLIAHSAKIDKDKMYVWFENNCPFSGPLYDDFRFADIETGVVVYMVVPKSGHSGKAELYGRENGFERPLAIGKMQDIYKFFGV